jgi:diguanylate cyclase (GGDEF)-like protein
VEERRVHASLLLPNPLFLRDPKPTMDNTELDDVRATAPVERLLEDSWEARSQRAGRRELAVESLAAAAFLAVAVPLAIPALAAHRVGGGLALLLIALYAVVAGAIRFPLGAGYVVPSYLILVPMLVLLPPATVPLFTAAGLLLASGAQWVTRRGSVDHALRSIPNAWYAIGPTIVVMIAGRPHGVVQIAVISVAAFVSGCLLDLGASTVREAAAFGVAPQLQLQVVAVVWSIDACIAPLGLLLAVAARHGHALVLMVLPLAGLMWVLDRDRNARIANAQHRLELVGRERTRLQGAVRRLGEAFAAKLELPALAGIVLHSSVEALDSGAGTLILSLPQGAPVVNRVGGEESAPLLEAACHVADRSLRPEQLERDGAWALAVPFGAAGDEHAARGVLAVSRQGRKFRPDEEALLAGLVERAHTAVREILAHEVLRQQAITDPLTGLGNRRKLSSELTERLVDSEAQPLVLMLFDLDGFKNYNDTFGHLAGDALLARLGGKLAAAVAPEGTAYRLGGDEFCALLPAPSRTEDLHALVTEAAGALAEQGETFSVRASCGAVLVPHEATTADYALQLADERMYARKRSRSSSAQEQAQEVLVGIMHAKQPDLHDHSTGVARLAVAVGQRLGMNAEELDELRRAAELHDVGKVAIPDAILNKPGKLDATEWEFMRQHTILGERILSAAPALRPVARIVRSSHERWDGSGYPDGLAGETIPMAARIVAVCDAYEAITSDRCYRKGRSLDEARAELLGSAGTQFDPTVVEVFVDELDQPYSTAAAPSDDHDPAWQLAEELSNRFAHLLGN